ncbi:hypothetical protein A361_15280 [Cytobacillus oceanisediminis 2691]|jgi:hypothetical protein|uniref:ABC transmembrane type-1 domain-containing protein n=1 Tax=Cytobacillus oceanisediminis 2691 TaxID=1196031 RepID=A0A161IYA9_9BACI|nr:hypothetical protein A361_15280 [Cytobacillus oceanisediminis 2691]EFV76375.1 hypothetical protein HMPREF1013_03305 [Bacillus sp. 2_A_57_CT2]
MRKINKLAGLCWDGLTLKHVSHKGIVIPYVLFFIITLIFELFLSALFILSFFLFSTYGYNPNIQYYMNAVILILMLVITVPLLITIMKVHNKVFLKKE